MGRNNFMEQLSPEIQIEFHERLVASKFSHYDGHAAWLAERGYTVSRSAIHRYAQALEKEVKAQFELRRLCAEAVSKYPGGDNPIDAAESLLNWVKNGSAKTLG